MSFDPPYWGRIGIGRGIPVLSLPVAPSVRVPGTSKLCLSMLNFANPGIFGYRVGVGEREGESIESAGGSLGKIGKDRGRVQGGDKLNFVFF